MSIFQTRTETVHCIWHVDRNLRRHTFIVELGPKESTNFVVSYEQIQQHVLNFGLDAKLIVKSNFLLIGFFSSIYGGIVL